MGKIRLEQGLIAKQDFLMVSPESKGCIVA